MHKAVRPVTHALRVLPMLLILPALLVLGSALPSGFATDAAGPSPRTPLQVTYYFLPG